MSYKLSITQKPGYLHAVVTGQNSRETALRYLEEVQRECAARNCHRLLIEERLEGPRLGATSVFEIAAEKSETAQGHFKAIAYVDVNAEGSLMQFAETVAINRGLPVRVFPSVRDAENWILGMVEGSARSAGAPDRKPG